jgi:phosphoserine phosphatase
MASSSGSIAATAVAAAAGGGGGAAVVAVSQQQQQQQQQRTLRGVVFDMDGTLTVPTIDFASMYRRVLGDDHPRIVSGSPIDILHEIAEWSPEKQVQAYAIIAEYEKQALERLQIMPGLSTSHLSSSSSSFTLRISCQKFL